MRFSSRTRPASATRAQSATLGEFDVLGEEVRDEEPEEIVKKGDPRRSLVRYRPDGSELFVSARVNIPLLRAAVSLPVLLLKPSSREDEVLKPSDPALAAAGGWDLLTPEGSRRNWGLLERISEDLTKAFVPACWLSSMARFRLQPARGTPRKKTPSGLSRKLEPNRPPGERAMIGM